MPRKKNPNNNYFNQEVEDAVCAYLHTDNQSEREKHFRIIYPALCKIAEVWYNKLKFSYSDDDREDVMANCVAWLVEKMDKFKCGQGTKAFSYYTVTAKFYYMQLSNKNYAYFKRYIPISDMGENWDVENSDSEDGIKSENAQFLFDFIKYLNTNFDSIFPSRYKPFAKIVLDTISNYEDIEDFRNRKVLQVIYKRGNVAEREKTKVNRAINIMIAQLNLFRKRWLEDDSSMQLLIKDYLTTEEKEIIKNTVRLGVKNNGATELARNFGVSVELVMNYAKSI